MDGKCLLSLSELIANLSSDRIYSIASTINPEGLARRIRKVKIHRGRQLFLGPNYVWSIDGYCKFEAWGIQIYAAIDCYSRYVIWLYVGLTGRSAYSVFSQYIEALDDCRVVPQILRSDRGAETIQAADAHYYLSSKLRNGGEPMLFSDYFKYGTSKMNQRIEAWWN